MGCWRRKPKARGLATDGRRCRPRVRRCHVATTGSAALALNPAVHPPQAFAARPVFAGVRSIARSVDHPLRLTHCPGNGHTAHAGYGASEDARVDWGERLRHGKWHIISGVLSIALSLWLYHTETKPKPPPRTWPPGNKPQYVRTQVAPEGRYTCQAEGAPAPVDIRFCVAGPDEGLKICDSNLIYEGGKPSFCVVSNCPPLPPHGKKYVVMLGCFLREEAPR